MKMRREERRKQNYPEQAGLMSGDLNLWGLVEEELNEQDITQSFRC